MIVGIGIVAVIVMIGVVLSTSVRTTLQSSNENGVQVEAPKPYPFLEPEVEQAG